MCNRSVTTFSSGRAGNGGGWSGCGDFPFE